MTAEMKNKIRNELNNAYVHMGETDVEYLNEKVEEDLETLMCFMAGSDPVAINTDKGELVGYVVNVAVGASETKDQVVALNMIITKTNICYVINSYIATKPAEWKPGNKKMISNESNRIVELADVDPAIFNN